MCVFADISGSLWSAGIPLGNVTQNIADGISDMYQLAVPVMVPPPVLVKNVMRGVVVQEHQAAEKVQYTVRYRVYAFRCGRSSFTFSVCVWFVTIAWKTNIICSFWTCCVVPRVLTFRWRKEAYFVLVWKEKKVCVYLSGLVTLAWVKETDVIPFSRIVLFKAVRKNIRKNAGKIRIIAAMLRP